MATKTRNDLVLQALANLGVLAAGQTPATEDFDTVDEHVDQVIASLDERGIITVDDVEAIPASWFGPLAVILADDAAPEFGLPGMPPSASSRDPVANAADLLRQMVRGKPTGEPMRGDYF